MPSLSKEQNDKFINATIFDLKREKVKSGGQLQLSSCNGKHIGQNHILMAKQF